MLEPMAAPTDSTNQANYDLLSADHTVSNRTDLSKSTQTTSCHGDSRGQIADFQGSCEWIEQLYLLYKWEIKEHFEWVLRHWSSFCQLNLLSLTISRVTKCQTDLHLVKISVKAPIYMFFIFMWLDGRLLHIQCLNCENTTVLPLVMDMIGLHTKVWPHKGKIISRFYIIP